jgi:hypothetical protein
MGHFIRHYKLDILASIRKYPCCKLIAHKEAVLDLDWSQQKFNSRLRLLEIRMVMGMTPHLYLNNYIFKSNSSSPSPNLLLQISTPNPNPNPQPQPQPQPLPFV